MTAKIPIIGVGPDGLEGLTARSREWLTTAEVVFGSDAALRLLPELKAERMRIGADLPEVVEKLRAGLGKKRMAIAATGDPLFYGTARYLCEKVGPDSFEVVPHVSSMQLAFEDVPGRLDAGKVGIIRGSVTSAARGSGLLVLGFRANPER